MIERILAEVPSHIWSEGQRPHERVVAAEFNVAGWLKLAGRGVAYLLFCHEDDAGRHACVVEHRAVNGESAPLMSGVVKVRFTGKVRKVEVVLKLSNDEMRSHLDELFVQRKPRETPRENKLVSR